MTKNFKIISEDESLIVIDKPAGLVVNRSHTTKDPTLQDFIDNEYNLTNIEDEEFSSRSGIVHRIDKDTSGIILVAKDKDTFYNLQSQFKKRSIKKTYIAIVHGHVDDDTIFIDAPIKRNPKIRFKMAVVHDGKNAVTNIEVRKRFQVDNEKLTFVYAFPKTGRTHQIRVHLSALGHPVVHDPIYCTRKLFVRDQMIANRMLLHAYKIELNHPKTGKIVEYSSEIPTDFNM